MTDPALPPTRTTKAAPRAANPAVAKPASPKAAAVKKAAAPRKTIVKPAAPKGKAAAKTAAPKAKTAATTKAKASAKTAAAKMAAAEATGAATPSADGLPTRATPVPKQQREALDLARRIVELAEDKKAADIVLLDLTALTTLADYFVICSGGSERQLDAIADGIVSPLRDEKTKPYGREGTPASHWVLLDFGSVVVHILTPPERDYYGIEKHWSEAKTVLRVQ